MAVEGVTRSSVLGSPHFTTSAMMSVYFSFDMDVVPAGVCPCTCDMVRLGHSTEHRLLVKPFNAFPDFSLSCQSEDFSWIRRKASQSALCSMAVPLNGNY